MTGNLKLASSIEKKVEHIYDLAVAEARKSECTRRKYGVVIEYPNTYATQDFHAVYGYNKRIGRCCDGNLCVRDRYGARNGQAVELGAEIHAEQMALTQWIPSARGRFVIACLNAEGLEVAGPTAFPCHVCALMIANAGFKYVWTRVERNSPLESISIWDIIEHREKEWEYSYDV